MTADAIKGVQVREETTLDFGGVGDCWNMTWADDDKQYGALCDGFSWPGMATQGYWSTRMFSIRGSAPDFVFEDLPGYPQHPLTRHTAPEDYRFGYYGFGTLSVDGRIYQYLSTRNTAEEWRFTGAKLIYSDDHGSTWHNQDGSTPVVWETWEQRSQDNMAFFREPGEAFSMISVLQMGRDYEHNTDGYVYLYAPNGNLVDTMNQLVLARVPKDAVLDRSAYEYFAGFAADGSPTWSGDIGAREPVCSFPEGWVLPMDLDVNPATQPHSWHPSVVYNEPLGVYMMANFGMGLTQVEDDEDELAVSLGAGGVIWFGKPSYLGIWVADTPWGPWRQIHEDDAWTPQGHAEARGYETVISPKWISEDGTSFWLVWTDFRRADIMSEPEYRRDLHALVRTDRFEEGYELHRRRMPRYGVNAQRIDLVV